MLTKQYSFFFYIEILVINKNKWYTILINFFKIADHLGRKDINIHTFGYHYYKKTKDIHLWRYSVTAVNNNETLEEEISNLAVDSV